MGEPKHTPGPWQFCPFGRIGFEVQGGGRSLAIVNQVGEKRLEHLDAVRSRSAARGEPAQLAEGEAQQQEATKDAALANSRLICAAPDLLQALKALAEYHGPAADHHKDDCTDDDCAECALDALVNRAIAKAEGRS